jgi:hypothetical protein
VDYVDDDHIAMIFDPAESSACHGDSGGPAIGRYLDENGYEHAGIVGITSTGSTFECEIDSETDFINLQKQSTLDFILSVDPAVKLL